MSAEDSENQGERGASGERGTAKATQTRPSKADLRKQRLANHLRENLKKRKDLTRSRKSSDQGGNSSANPS